MPQRVQVVPCMKAYTRGMVCKLDVQTSRVVLLIMAKPRVVLLIMAKPTVVLLLLRQSFIRQHIRMHAVVQTS